MPLITFLLEAPLFRRTAASVALVTALAAAVTGCAFVTPQATEIHYQASDGTEANVGPLQLRNFVIISDTGTDGTLVGAISNTSGAAVKVELKYRTTSGSQVSIPVTVAALGVTPVGYDGQDGLMTDISTTPGALFPVFVSTDGAEGQDMTVPVLDGSQPQFGTLVPVPPTAPTVTPTATDTPTPAPTATN